MTPPLRAQRGAFQVVSAARTGQARTCAGDGATDAFAFQHGFRDFAQSGIGNSWRENSRFSGGRSAQHDAEALGRLRTWMQAEGLKELSPAVYGYFDPPWTPAFLRRNEVMLRTEAGQ